MGDEVKDFFESVGKFFIVFGINFFTALITILAIKFIAAIFTGN